MRMPELRCNGEDAQILGLIRSEIERTGVQYEEVPGDERCPFVEFTDDRGMLWSGKEAIGKWAALRLNGGV